jgi:hypothetical protein
VVAVAPVQFEVGGEGVEVVFPDGLHRV